MFYLTTYPTYLKKIKEKELVYGVGHIVNDYSDRRKEGNILFGMCGGGGGGLFSLRDYFNVSGILIL